MMKLLNFCYVFLFSINSLASVIVATLSAHEWSSLTPTQRFVIAWAIIGNWATLMLALLHQLAKKIKEGGGALIPDEEPASKVPASTTTN